jgi:cytochrome c556
VPLADDRERVWFSRMIGHALDMGQLTNAVLALSYPQVHERARALAREAASPELGERAQALAEAAAHEDPEAMARAYGKLTEACVTCHVARRGAR